MQIKLVTALLLVHSALSVRDEALDLDKVEAETTGSEMSALVPAGISRALKKANMKARNALDEAVAAEAHAVEKKKLADETSQKAANEMKEKQRLAAEQEALVKKNSKLAKAAADASVKSGTSVEALTEAQTLVQARQGEMEKASSLYLSEMARVKEETRKLEQQLEEAMNQMEFTKQALADADVDANRKQIEADAAGHVDAEAAEKYREAQTELDAANKALNTQLDLADKATAEAETARIDAERAGKALADAKSTHHSKQNFKESLLALRNSVNIFYDAIDAFTKSMEADESNLEDAPEKVRKDPNLPTALKKYNEMVLTFSSIHNADKEIYKDLAPNVDEIQQNAEQGVLLQCDPFGELEKKGKETGNYKDFYAKCGNGVWTDLGIPKKHFPKINKVTAQAT